MDINGASRPPLPICAAHHPSTAPGVAASKEGMSDRDCLFACIKALATYVLVDQNNQVIPIVNQDAMGIPLYAGRPVKLTGEKRGDAIFVTKVEAGPTIRVQTKQGDYIVTFGDKGAKLDAVK